MAGVKGPTLRLLAGTSLESRSTLPTFSSELVLDVGRFVYFKESTLASGLPAVGRMRNYCKPLRDGTTKVRGASFIQCH